MGKHNSTGVDEGRKNLLAIKMLCDPGSELRLRLTGGKEKKKGKDNTRQVKMGWGEKKKGKKSRFIFVTVFRTFHGVLYSFEAGLRYFLKVENTLRLTAHSHLTCRLSTRIMSSKRGFAGVALVLALGSSAEAFTSFASSRGASAGGNAVVNAASSKTR